MGLCRWIVCPCGVWDYPALGSECCESQSRSLLKPVGGRNERDDLLLCGGQSYDGDGHGAGRGDPLAFYEPWRFFDAAQYDLYWGIDDGSSLEPKRAAPRLALNPPAKVCVLPLPLGLDIGFCGPKYIACNEAHLGLRLIAD